ncbi:MAG: T9SS type A sorting domain-containing protein, partial [Rhodothermales bacterium]|nr:T9SS type A sorting domain-containing protein [Rhodothermales bacterium]
AKGATASSLLAAFGRIELADASGSHSTLWLNGRLPENTPSMAYTVPPTSPGSGFAASFAGGRYVSESARAEVTLSGASFPVTITPSTAMTVEVLAGDQVASVLSAPAGATLEVADAQATRLRLSTGGAAELPAEFSLEQNYPNPFNPVTTIRFGLPEATGVTLEIFDMLGRRVAQLASSEPFAAGWHTVNFDARHHTSGQYFYRIRTEGHAITKRMVLLK